MHRVTNTASSIIDSHDGADLLVQPSQSPPQLAAYSMPAL
jgi:hypothetical protein